MTSSVTHLTPLALLPGVWSVHNMLDAAYDPGSLSFESYTLSIEVEDVPGVLNQVCNREGIARKLVMQVSMRGQTLSPAISPTETGRPPPLHTYTHTHPYRPPPLFQVTGVFARRGYNVQSLAVGNSEREGMSRITMVIPGDSSGVTKLVKQLYKLVYVQKVGVGAGFGGPVLRRSTA
jgi:acetolactate synthase regulatory subunit